MSLLSKVCLLFLILLFYLFDLQGQTLFQPGYVITNENDTLHGLIDYRGDTRNARRCDYKADLNSDVQEYTPLTLKGYRFTDGKYYVSKIVKSNDKEVQLFLEYLVNGISDLYFYADISQNHYFIEKAGEELIELTNERKIISVEGKDYIRDSKNFVGLLKYAYGDCPQIFPLINKARFENKSLIDITKRYHDIKCDGEKCIIYEKQLPVMRWRFAPFLSMNNTFLNFTDLAVYEDISFKMASSVSVGISLNAAMPDLNEKLSFQASAEYGKNYYYGTSYLAANKTFEEVHLHASSIKFKGGLKYTWPKGNFRPTLLMGGNLIRSLKSDGRRIQENYFNSIITTQEYTDLKMSNLLVGYNFELGIDYRKSESYVPFINIGFSNSSGMGNHPKIGLYSTHLKTIHINAGIYF
jgi:hypothetical protein